MGFPVADATNASLIFANVGTNHAGVYAVTVTNLLGSIVSSNASLTVLTIPPIISAQPADLTVVAGETSRLAVLAVGTPPFGYQWNFNGSPLADASGASLTWTNVGTNQAGNYSVTVTNLYGSVLSSNASLTVLVLATNLFDDFEPGIDLAQWSSFGGTVLATNYGGFCFALAFALVRWNGVTLRHHPRGPDNRWREDPVPIAIRQWVFIPLGDR